MLYLYRLHQVMTLMGVVQNFGGLLAARLALGYARTCLGEGFARGFVSS